MTKTRHNILISLSLLASVVMSSCSDDTTTEGSKMVEITLTSDIQPFEGEDLSRASLEGNTFNQGDLIRMKIICPFAPDTQRGESTESGSYDGFYLLKASGGAGNTWSPVTAADGFDITGGYSASNSPKIESWHEAQQTPYVFTADTWSEERHFIVGTSLILQYTNVFHHDQRKEKHHLASDVLWAQTIMQTGGTNVHLSFEHKMALLDINVVVSEVSSFGTLTDQAYLTLEKMPDIDHREIIIGNYYADEDIYGSSYGYRQKHSCQPEYNGKVIGVGEIDEANGKRAKLSLLPGGVNPEGGNTVLGTAIACTGTYTAYKVDNNHYRLMVPPCTLTDNAVFWLRDGEKRYSVKLERKEFVGGCKYPVTLKISITE